MGRLLPAMTQEKLDTQRDVVKNERRWSVDNQPYGTWWEKVPALAFPPSHPFHHSLIGSMEDLSAASLQDVQDFSRTYYTPANAVLTIAGDFDAREARRLVNEYFGAIPRGPEKPPLPAMDVAELFAAPLREVVVDEVMLPRLFLAFRSPVFGSEGYYAASLCSAILGARKGSRLYRALVREKQIAAEANAFTFDLSKGSDLLIADVTARPEVAADQLESEVNRVVDGLLTDKPREEELQRALALVETEFLTAMQVAADRADKLSMFATYFRNPELANEQVERYRAVTVQDIHRFADHYLVPNNRAALLYVPRNASSGDAGAAA
jgi:predicted Zn-dependent peptidase